MTISGALVQINRFRSSGLNAGLSIDLLTSLP